MMQGGGGGNGYVAYPAGASYAGDKPALSRGFAVDSTDTGHKAKTGAFDFSFMRDQQAYLNFAFLANAEVAGIAKQIIARYYAKPAGYSYFVGCSTGGREGMILSQRSHSQLRLPGNRRIWWSDADHRAHLSCRSSPALSTNTHQLCRMTLHHGRCRNYLAHNQLEIPTRVYRSSDDITSCANYLNASAVPTSSDRLAQWLPRHSWMLPEVLPAPFKLHKPSPPCRLPSSRCI